MDQCYIKDSSGEAHKTTAGAPRINSFIHLVCLEIQVDFAI